MRPQYSPSPFPTSTLWLALALAFALSACDDDDSQGLSPVAGEEINPQGGERTEPQAGETAAGAAGAQAGIEGMTTAGTQAGETAAVEAGDQGGEMITPITQVCSNSIVLTCDSGVITVDTSMGTAAHDSYVCGNGFNYPGKELIFEFIEGAPQTVDIAIRQTEQQFLVNYMLFALEGNETACTPSEASCIAQQDTLIAEPLRLEYEPSRPLWLALDPRISPDASMSFEVEVSCSTTVCGDGVVSEDETCDDGNLAAGDGCNERCEIEETYLCSGSPSVCVSDQPTDCQEVIEASSGTFMGDTRACQSDYMTISGGCGNENAVSGPDQSYLVTIPANQALRASLSAVDESGFNIPKMWLALDPEQASSTCVQSASDEITWLNGSDEERNILLTVDGVSAEDQGVYQLTIELLDSPERPGSSCASPHILTESGVTRGDTSGGRFPESNLHGGVGGECVRYGGFWGYGAGPDEIYSVTLAPGQSLTASSSPVGTWDHVLSIHDSCSDFELSCLTWDDYGRGSVINEGESTREYFIMVSGFYSYSFGEYDLEISIE